MATYTSPFTGNIIVPTDVSYNSFTLTEDTTLIWSDAAPRSSTLANVRFFARIMDVNPAAANTSLTLPAANEGSLGSDSLIRNIGGFEVTIKDNGGNVLYNLLPGRAQWNYLTQNNTAAGVWRSVTFGAGNSITNASELAGGGLAVDNSGKLSVGSTIANVYQGPYTTSDANNGQTINFESSSQSTINLHAPSLNRFTTAIRNNADGELEIVPPAGYSIDNNPNAQSIVLTPGESSYFVLDSTNDKFITVGRNRLSNFYFSVANYDITTTGATINLTDYAAIILSIRQSGAGQLTTVQLPQNTNTYYVINESNFDITFQIGTASPPGGNVVTIGANESASIIADGTNLYATNVVPVGALTLTSSSRTAPGLAIEEAGVKTTGFYALSGEAGVTVNNGASYFAVETNRIVLSPGTTGLVSGVLDGGYIV